MGNLTLVLDIPIWLTLAAFVAMTTYYVKKVRGINAELYNLLSFLKKFKKADLFFKFKELDDGMSQNSYVSKIWADFKNTLMFSESVSLKNETNEVVFQNISQAVKDIQTTVDPIYFFNEENLITSRMNYKFVQTVPALLTGLGPLFTFFNIALVFAKMDFSSSQATLSSVGQLMSSMQISATVSLLAIATSLIFLFIERVMYNNKCKTPLGQIQETIASLFDNIASEKFLIELLKETKIQNNQTKNLLSVLPQQFKGAIDKSLATILVPYLENMIFGINKLQEGLADKKKKSNDVVDDLF